MNQIDIRFPLGLLFLLLGLVLIGYGLMSEPQIHAAHSSGQNVNLLWGAVFALFGAGALGLSKRAADRR
jgi:hypothetical protein